MRAPTGPNRQLYQDAVLTLEFHQFLMPLCDIFLRLGEPACGELLRSVSLGKLRTYQLFDRMKARLHVTKLNSESLKKIAPRVWQRFEEKDETLAQELAQCILISHLDMIKAVLDFLEIPHEDGFFAKDLEPKKYLTDSWQQRVFEKFKGVYPETLLVFYVNHLSHEVLEGAEFTAPKV